MKLLKSKSNKKTVFNTALLAVAFTTSTLLTGCAGASKENVATIAGSVIGGAAGYQFGTTQAQLTNLPP